jgi:hypothetical protein
VAALLLLPTITYLFAQQTGLLGALYTGGDPPGLFAGSLAGFLALTTAWITATPSNQRRPWVLVTTLIVAPLLALASRMSARILIALVAFAGGFATKTTLLAFAFAAIVLITVSARILDDRIPTGLLYPPLLALPPTLILLALLVSPDKPGFYVYETVSWTLGPNIAGPAAWASFRARLDPTHDLRGPRFYAGLLLFGISTLFLLFTLGGLLAEKIA